MALNRIPVAHVLLCVDQCPDEIWDDPVRHAKNWVPPGWATICKNEVCKAPNAVNRSVALSFVDCHKLVCC